MSSTNPGILRQARVAYPTRKGAAGNMIGHERPLTNEDPVITCSQQVIPGSPCGGPSKPAFVCSVAPTGADLCLAVVRDLRQGDVNT